MLATRVLVSVLGGCLLSCAGSQAGGGGGGGGGDDGGGDGGGGGGCCDATTADGAPGAVDAAAGGDAAACGALAGKNGFPGDFPELVDQGGFGQGQAVVGFGGDASHDRACNRAAIGRRPVILLHGNGSTPLHAQYGMLDVAAKLRVAGYADAEIWAPGYLGQQVSYAETSTPQRNNVEDVRDFIDAVVTYLGVDRVDIVGHSLGCTMANGYLRGLTADGSFDPALERSDRIGTVVCLGGGLYGTGSGFLYDPEFNVDGAWVQASLTLGGVEDATPFGAAAVSDMHGPPTGGQLPKNRDFHVTSTLDGGARRIYWVALWSIGDIVDGNLHNACGLGGADLNLGFELSGSVPGVLTPQLARHVLLLHDQDVFDAMVPYLDR